MSGQDVRSDVTERIMAQLEAGRIPWRQPWKSTVGQPQSIDGRPYRGINALLLGMSGYGDPRWGTFNAIRRHGGRVRKGEKSTVVVLWKPFVTVDKETGERVRRLMLRYFRVFNVEQADGLNLKPLDRIAPLEPDEVSTAVQRVLDEYVDGPTVHYGGDAWYDPQVDVINLPELARFESSSRFATTAFHEAIHSTGHSSRLARDEVVHGGRFGSPDYSREELVAEMGAAMTAALLGIEVDYPQSGSYIKGWLQALDNDKGLIISAAARAQHAVDRLLGLDPPKQEGDES